MVDHADDRRHAAALLAHQAAAHAVELDLGRGQRAGAELVLEPLDPEARVAALDQEAGQPAGRLGEREEDVAGRIGAEPLVAGDLVQRRRRRARRGWCWRARPSRPASRSWPCRPARRPRSWRGSGAAPTRRPAPGSRAARGSPSRSSRPGTSRPRSPGSRRTSAPPRTTCAPGRGSRHGQRVDLALDRLAQQPVPGRVELHLVDAVAVAVVGAQHAARCARRARSARAPRPSRPARRCRAGGPRPSRRPRARAPRAARGRRRRRCRAPAAAPGWSPHAWAALASTGKRLLTELDEGFDQGSSGSRAGRSESGPTSASPSAPTSAAATVRVSCGRSSPAAHAVVEHAREHVAVAAAQPQPLRLDGGVDRLGDQRVGAARGRRARGG